MNSSAVISRLFSPTLKLPIPEVETRVNVQAIKSGSKKSCDF
jgi:hypothetical protein